MKFPILGAVTGGLLLVTVICYYSTYDIWRAVRNGNTSYVERYLKIGGAVDTIGEFGYDDNSLEGNYSLLMEAARYGQPEMVKLLISRGADENRRSTTGRCPLWYAEKRGNSEIMIFLLENGAELV